MLPPSDQDDSTLQFSKARELLSQLIGLPDIAEVLDEDSFNARRVYTQAPTLWLLVLQRLGGGLSLKDAVEELLEHHRDLLPPNRRVNEGTLSKNNSAYSKARKELLLDIVTSFSNRICDYLAARSEPVFLDSRVFIIDGTTITLPPTAALKKKFPPATNQHGQSVWPVAMLMVASELSTGCVLVPQVDAMYGENNSSEAKQAEKIIDRLPDNSIVLADSGFGIFSVAHHCHSRGKKFLFRLSGGRFKALKKKATLVEKDDGSETWHLLWQPSVKDRQTNPHLGAEATVEVFVHRIALEDGKDLYLVSNLEVDASSQATLYLRRYDVEFDIRDLKVTMDTENLRAKSVDTVMKELMASVVAYNLVAQLRRQAAKLARVEPRRLSFSGVWLTFKHQLLYKEYSSYEEWQFAFQRALISAGDHKLPNRSRARSYPRIAHPRRPKTTKFQKSLRKKDEQKPQKPPD